MEGSRLSGKLSATVHGATEGTMKKYTHSLSTVRVSSNQLGFKLAQDNPA